MSLSGLRKREHSIGVSVSDTTPDTRIATPIVTANSWKSRPSSPPRKSTGMNTDTSDSVIERIVKPISREPFSAAVYTGSPFSMWRTMFSSMTIASSTTKPTDNVSAINERLSRLYPSRYMTAKVPTSDMGSARLGITVAEMFLRKRKITITTRQSVMNRVNFTSCTDSWMEAERSYMVWISTEGGNCFCISASAAFTSSATFTVLVPGWR